MFRASGGEERGGERLRERERLQMFLSVYLNKNTRPADSDKLTHRH